MPAGGLRRAKRAAIRLAHKTRSNVVVVDTGDTSGQVSRYRVWPEREEATGFVVLFTATPDSVLPESSDRPGARPR